MVKQQFTKSGRRLGNRIVKFTDSGMIIISSARHKDGVVISVKDTGIGIKETDMDKLFHSFSQIHNMTDRKSGGTGLGLVISKAILEQHGGTIWAQSRYGRGSTFSFLLPRNRKKATMPLGEIN